MHSHKLDVVLIFRRSLAYINICEYNIHYAWHILPDCFQQPIRVRCFGPGVKRWWGYNGLFDETCDRESSVIASTLGL